MNKFQAFSQRIRPYRRWIVVGVVVVTMLLFGLLQLGTAENTPTGAVVQAMGNVRIRSLPSLSGDRIGSIGWGEQAYLKAIDASGDWYQIDYNGITGWSAAEWFAPVSGNVGSVPQASIANPTGVVVRALGNMRIRTQPSLSGERIGLIGWGEQASLLEVSNGWYKINYAGLIGWSSAEWFEVLSGDANSLITHEATNPSVTTAQALGNVKIRQAPDINAARVGFVPWGEVVIVKAVDVTGEWQLIEYNGVEGWSVRSWYRILSGDVGNLITEGAATAIPSSPTGVVVHALGNVRLRELPNINSTRIGLIGWGEYLPVLDIDASGNWIKVDFGGIVGWTAREWYEVTSGNLGAIGSGISNSSGVTAISYGNVRIRSAPTLRADRVGLVPWGATVTVTGIDATRTWYRIEYNGLVGWTFRDWYRISSGESGRLPIIR